MNLPVSEDKQSIVYFMPLSLSLSLRFSEADLATLMSQTVLEESLTHLTRCKEAAAANSQTTSGETGGQYTNRCMMMSLRYVIMMSSLYVMMMSSLYVMMMSLLYVMMMSLLYVMIIILWNRGE